MSQYFQTQKKGEISELRADLNSLDKNKVKEAVKKVIAAMTVGKDVGSLFTDVVKNMHTDNLELKKLIYLYIINYARSHPDKAILIVNSFQKDADDKSPLLRALAIRTMGCIRVDRITEYLAEPLGRALKDKDPYVRKTAAVCVAKLYDINPELVEEQGFLERLRELIGDANPMVVANAVAALAEISETSGKDYLRIDSAMLQKLLNALNEASEWGQVFILDMLAKYQPTPKEAEDIVERVRPRLKHVNSAVAMSAVKVIMRYLDIIQNEALVKTLIEEKLPPPLITLLSEGKPEIQYVALRNIDLIVQKRPEILANSVKHFFCKYNDPIYVKMEKLEIMIKLANAKNIDKVLMEFKEYASEVDVEFVRKAVRAIGRCAIKLEKAAERCVKVLLELIQTKVNYVVQEAIIVIKDIFRKYPNRYESIIGTLCENLESLDEPEAKASMIWIIGEYADRIDNAPQLLETFVETFDEENAQVQLQLLTAVVKLFLKRPEDGKDLVSRVLNLATQNTDNPDLRDRGYIYWRLLSTDPEAAQQVVLANRPPISDDTYQLDPSVLDILIANLSTLASIYHKPPEFFVKEGRTLLLKSSAESKKRGEYDDEEEGSDEGEGPVDSEGTELEAKVESKSSAEGAAAPSATPSAAGTQFIDLLGLMGAPSPAPAQPTQPVGVSPLADLMGLGAVLPSTTPAPAPAPAPTAPAAAPAAAPAVTGPARTPVRQYLSAAACKGFQLSGCFMRRNGVPTLELLLENHTTAPLSQFAIKFNVNHLGLAPAAPLKPGVVAPGSQVRFSLPLHSEGALSPQPAPVQMAIKTELGVFLFQEEKVPAFILLAENGQLDRNQFLQIWKKIPDTAEVTATVSGRTVADLEATKARLASGNVFFVASPKNSTELGYFSCSLRGVSYLVEVTLRPGFEAVVAVRSEEAALSPLVLQAVADLLTLAL